MNVQVLGVSADTVHSHKAFARECGNAEYPLLSDFFPQGEVAKKYGVWLEQGRNQRASFLIDEDGIVRWKKVYERAPRDSEDVLDAVAQL